MLNILQSLEENKKYLEEILHSKKSNDVQIRDIDICINNKITKGFFVSYDGLVNTDLINNYIIRALMNRENTIPENPEEQGKVKSFLKKLNKNSDSNSNNLIDIISNSILSDLQITKTTNFDEITREYASWRFSPLHRK